MSSRRPRGSRPADGSSKTRTCGSIDSTVASATRLRWPRLIRWGIRRSKPDIPTAASARSTRSWISSSAIAHVERAEGDVLEHRRAEELVVGILEDQAHLGPDPPDRRSLDDRAVDPDQPWLGRWMPLRCEHQRAFAGAVWADERDLLTRGDGEVYAVESLEPVRVAEVEVLDLDRRGARLRRASDARAWTWRISAWLRVDVLDDVTTATAPDAERRRDAGEHQRNRAGRSASAVHVPELALEAARLHGGVDPLAPLVGAQEEEPTIEPVTRARQRTSRRRVRLDPPSGPPGPASSARLVGEDRQVAVHEADDRDHDRAAAGAGGARRRARGTAS